MAERKIYLDGTVLKFQDDDQAAKDLDSIVKGENTTFADNPYTKDEDDMGSDSAVHVASQQSIKAYVDNEKWLTRVVVLKVIADDTVLTTGNGKMHFTIPIELNGCNLVSVGAHVYTVSSSGTPTVQIHNLTDTTDMLSTEITIDANEKDSKDAATPAVIDTGEDDVVTGDEIRIDVDVAGTDTLGLEIRMGFKLP